jgi:hypothetical protein
MRSDQEADMRGEEGILKAQELHNPMVEAYRSGPFIKTLLRIFMNSSMKLPFFLGTSFTLTC